MLFQLTNTGLKEGSSPFSTSTPSKFSQQIQNGPRMPNMRNVANSTRLFNNKSFSSTHQSLNFFNKKPEVQLSTSSEHITSLGLTQNQSSYKGTGFKDLVSQYTLTGTK